MDVGFVFLETLHTHLDRIRDFLVVVEKNLFTDDFCNKELGWLVGQLVFVKIGRTLGQEFLDAVQNRLDVELVQSRYGQDFGFRKKFVPPLDKGSQVFLVGQVYLVDEHKYRHFHPSHFCQEIGIFVSGLLRVGHVEQHVGIDQGTLGKGQHGLLQLVVGLQHTWRVGKDNLRIIVVDDAHDAMTSCLGLEGGDGDALAYQEVHKCRFTHIGIAHDIYKT